MARYIPENKLWKIVKKGLERKEYGYICSNSEVKSQRLKEGFLCMGIGDVQADVIGFKDVGTFRQPKLEIIAVEVKPDLPNYRQRHIDQAKRTSLYAHKCFFAAPREFEAKEIEIAVNSGIGLFQIDTKNKKLKQVAPSREMNPDETKIIHLMNNLGYYKCAICNCCWNREFAPSGYRPHHYFSSKKSNEFYKFICDKCIQRIFKQLSPRLREEYTEEWKFKRLDKRASRIDKKVEVWVNWLERRMLSKTNRLEKRINNWFSWLERRSKRKDNKLERQLKDIKRKLKSL